MLLHAVTMNELEQIILYGIAEVQWWQQLTMRFIKNSYDRTCYRVNDDKLIQFDLMIESISRFRESEQLKTNYS